ncbi:MAG: MFS transporter, partial [Thermoanaerobaculia bacterium]
MYRSISFAVLVFGLGYIGLALSGGLAMGAVAVFIAHLGGGAQWQTSTYGLQREVPDWIRGRVFSADYGFLTLTMSISALVTGIAADRFGPVAATVATASICVVWAVTWGTWTWRLWR